MSQHRHSSRATNADLLHFYGRDADNLNASYDEGDQVTLADLCLVPQVGAAMLFKIPLDDFPNCVRVFKACMENPAFFDARPQAQPDFPEDMK